MHFFTSSSYKIYYRKLNSNKPLFLEKKFDGFVKIKTPIFYWAADPFIVEFGGGTYIFAELYHRFLNIGRIAYQKVSNKRKWVFLTSFRHHFSFPNPIIIDNRLYIIPETSSQKFVGIFDAFDFSKYNKIISNFPGVDTVFNTRQNKLFSYDQESFELHYYSWDIKNNKAIFLKSVN